MEQEKKRESGFLNETDPKKSIVNLAIIFATVAGFGLLTYAVIEDKESAYFPISSVISVALGGVAIKANRKTS